MSVKEKSLEVLDLETILVEQKDLILYNDDYNTFEHVIKILQKYCDHTDIQAEQCAWIVHNNGRCSVKRGEYAILKPICEAILESGLTAKIE